jgi:hypothetical protein
MLKTTNDRGVCENTPENKGPKKGMKEKEVIIFCVVSKTIAL